MDWRTTGDTTYEAFAEAFPSHSEVKKRGETRAVYEAARPYTRLVAGMLDAESSMATDFDAVPASRRNPLNMKPFDRTYDSIAQNVTEWKNRITSPTYKDGIYKNTRTIADLIHVYAPASDNNDEQAYVRRVEAMIDRLPRAGGEESPVETIVFGRVPKPANIVPDFVDKPRYNGWDNYGVRDKLLAIILHRVLGYARTTGSYFRDPGSGHGYGALTDWGVCGSMDAEVFGAAWDGKIMDWNDPDGRGLYRSPYASGGTGPIVGDGVAWVAKYGRGNAINRYGEAVELSGLTNNAPVSPKMLESVINLVAWRVDSKGRIPYNVWPNNNDGVHMILSHNEMGKPQCHVPDAVFADVIDGVREVLKKYQVVSGPVDPEPDPEPDSPYPPGMTPELARELWNGPDGALKLGWSSKPFDYDEDKKTCQKWLERCVASIPENGAWADGIWPYLASVTRRGNKSVHVYQFSDGWVLEHRIRPDPTPMP